MYLYSKRSENRGAPQYQHDLYKTLLILHLSRNTFPRPRIIVLVLKKGAQTCPVRFVVMPNALSNAQSAIAQIKFCQLLGLLNSES